MATSELLSEEVIKELVSTPAFLSNCNKLAYELHIPHASAAQELLLELLFHRLRKWSNKDVTMAIAQDLPSLKWRIKYARKDIVRKQAKDAMREREKAQMVAHMTRPQASNEAETLEALEILPELFKNKATQQWAESVLQVGRRETIVRFGQTPRQFNDKLAKVCKYAHRHRQQPKQTSDTKELQILNEWGEIMANEGTTDDDIQAFIDRNQGYINEVINSPLVKFQATLVKDFAHAGKDKYVFINLMAKREQELKESK
ncbi:hypothetical protein OH774_13795 [Lacticaseibacillus rhamnosus]